MWLTSSSIGRKFVMALTGAFLVLFVTFHVLMNGVALFWPTAYNVVCEFLGANWYALVGTAVLAAGFILHILYALWLTWENRCARGNNRYQVTSRPPQVEWSSKNMLVLGIVIICFLIVHMYQFWAKMQLVEILGLEGEFPPAAGTLFIQQAFSCPWTLVIYLIGFAALWLHMTHGIWSMFQSSGINNSIWLKRWKCIANIWATFVCLLFAAEAIVFTVNAKREVYLSCPALQEQYIEMILNECGGCPLEAVESECGTCPFEAAQQCEGVCPEAAGACGDCAAMCADCGACDEACAAANCNQCPNAGKCGDCGDCSKGQCDKAAGCEGHHGACDKAAVCEGQHECEHHHGVCPKGEVAPVENQVSETLKKNI